ncbi:DNA uptake protein related DNA-binding protein [Pediococcus stilesii]|uniref:DNA uptake protein related DNA-binding protein n=2 Tax=Pediococcus stilesii TaxID=331679 RepID=A0A0R2KX92_9LACO|nr:ComEA family DNA-binding protein [Pediococcus stilesii]KRN94049.1 DNA uptake protein related DNA-binding protein [Pediococcus stilesii]
MEEIWEKYQKQIIITAVAVIIVAMFFSILVGAGKGGQNQQSESSLDASSSFSMDRSSSMSNGKERRTNSSDTPTKPSKNQKTMVDVKGAVKNPGVYEVKDGMRVIDAVEIAGGMTNSADRKNINMAQQLSDQQVIYVPVKGEVKDAVVQESENKVVGGSAAEQNGSGSSKSTKLVNINSATKEELQSLNGVGEKKADQIINFREEQGEFKTIEDLKKVQGIGQKIFEGLQDSITV